MAIKTFIWHGDWNIALSALNDIDRLQAYDAIVRYGAENIEPKNLSEPAQAVFALIKPRIDYTKSKYESSIEVGKTGGRKLSYNPYELAKLRSQGYTAQQAAEKIGVTKSTVDHADAWRNYRNYIF